MWSFKFVAVVPLVIWVGSPALAQAQQDAASVLTERPSSTRSAADLSAARFSISVTGSPEHPVLAGTTDLPNGTFLFIDVQKPWVDDALQRLAQGRGACGENICLPAAGPNGLSGATVVVQDHRFAAGPFSLGRSDPFKPGMYVVSISRTVGDIKTASIEEIRQWFGSPPIHITRIAVGIPPQPFGKRADELAADAAVAAGNKTLRLALERGRATKDAWEEAAKAAAQAAQNSELASGRSKQIAAIVMQQVFYQTMANGEAAMRDERHRQEQAVQQQQEPGRGRNLRNP
jgi:hypothetical protein